MKKIILSLICVCFSYLLFAQTTVTICATGALGSFTTGSAIETLPSGIYTRNDNVIAVTSSPSPGQIQRGYAVFDLSTIPVGATICNVTLGLNVSGWTGGIAGTCLTIGRVTAPLDLSTVSVPNTLFADCATGTTLWSALSSSAVGSGSYGPGVGNITMSGGLGSAAANYIASEVGNVISIGFSISAGATTVYNFSGETNSCATTGLHAPYLQITYNYIPTGVTATINPSPVCTGHTFSLNGTATGASSYQWYGPAGSGFSSTSLSTTSIANPTSAGVYTFVATATCGPSTLSAQATATLVVNPSPAALVVPANVVCSGNTINLSDVTAGGNWSTANTLVATVSNVPPYGAVYGVNAGSALISYTLGSCSATALVTVNNPPTVVSGPTEVCTSGGTITLSDGSSPGTWTSSNPTFATVDPSSGVVTGVSPGSLNINYITGACPSVTYPITVDPLPTIILGGNAVCVNASITLSDATTGGTWTTSNTNIAIIGNSSGILTGITAAVVTVTYTLPTGCYVTSAITVNPLPASVSGPNSVCVGSMITLSDATTGGTWSSSAAPVATIVTGSGVVTGVTQGSTDITYTLPVTACFITYSVTVDPLPATITGPNKVCAQSVIVLNDLSGSGTWSSQLSAIATVDPALGDVTGVSSGLSLISYMLSGTGCYTTYAVTVNPLPVATITPAGPTTFCTGGSVVLNAAVSAGYNYQWFSNGGTIVGANTFSYTSSSTELVTVQVTDANGCVKMSAGTQVTLIPAVTIVAGGPIVFCQPGNVLLTVPLAPGILYTWKLNGSVISGANTNTYTATLNGVYTCDLVVPGGCSSTTPPFTIVVYDMPNPPVFYSGTQLATNSGYFSYQWFLNTTAIPGANASTVAPASNGSYKVRVTDGNGCAGYSSTFVISNLSVELIKEQSIKVYPNPANVTLHISGDNITSVNITDLLGQTVFSNKYNTQEVQVNVAELPKGIYFVKVNGSEIRKFVKE